MNRFFRNLRKGIRRALNVKTITLDGITISTDGATISKQVRNGLFKETYEEPERILIREALKPNDRVLEIGGGIGFVSLLCAKICGPQNVLTYEANPKMLATIQRNYALNGLAATLRSKAVTARDREVTFFISDNIISSSLHERKEGRPQTVPADPLDEVIAEWKPTAIVMDVEGAETSILPASNLVGVKKLILELHPHIVGEPAVADLKTHLRKLGFAEKRAIHKSSYFARVSGHIKAFG
jgi:FkbM family methyltransferase